ncbi:MAG: hypothetical protein IKU27_09085 [Clostridia bacterium]|nr:hypothetical protein [Clostridia bacterium]
MSDPSVHNVTAFDFASSPSNVTKFRADNRLPIISAIRSVALCGLLAVLVFCIFHYQEDLNVQNIRRMVSYIDKLTFSGSEIDTFDFDSGLSTSYEAFDIGIATVSGGNFRFIPPFEGMDYSEQVKYAQPKLKVSGNSIYVYDLGGKGISRMSSYSKLAETTVESKILALSANDNGQCAVVTDEEGYRTALTVFDKHLNEIYKWQTSDHFAFLPALSPNGKTAAALCIGQQGGDANFYVRYQPLNGDDCTVVIQLGDRRVYAMEYAENDRLLILCDDGLLVYDDQGMPVAQYPFAAGSLNTFSYGNDGSFALSLKGDRGDTSRLLVLNTLCEVVFDGTYEGDIRTIDYAADTLAFLSGSQLYCVNTTENTVTDTELSGVRGLLITGGGKVAAILGDRACIVDFTQGE